MTPGPLLGHIIPAPTGAPPAATSTPRVPRQIDPVGHAVSHFEHGLLPFPLLGVPLLGLRWHRSVLRESPLEPPHEGLLLGGGEIRLRVHHDVVPGGHRAPLGSPARFGGLPLGSVPLGEVQRPPAPVHIALNEPGDGGDLRVPRSDLLVAVAVVASPNGQVVRRRINGDVALQVFFLPRA